MIVFCIRSAASGNHTKECSRDSGNFRLKDTEMGLMGMVQWCSTEMWLMRMGNSVGIVGWWVNVKDWHGDR